MALERGDTNGAIDSYLQAVNAKPEVYSWWINLGRAYQQAGRKNEATDAYKHAAEFKGASLLQTSGHGSIRTMNLGDHVRVDAEPKSAGSNCGFHVKRAI